LGQPFPLHSLLNDIARLLAIFRYWDLQSQFGNVVRLQLKIVPATLPMKCCISQYLFFASILAILNFRIAKTTFCQKDKILFSVPLLPYKGFLGQYLALLRKIQSLFVFSSRLKENLLEIVWLRQFLIFFLDRGQ